MSEKKRNVVIITDGDEVASETIQEISGVVGGRCISRSAGNPTPLTGEQIVAEILKAHHDPVFVMFDDCGNVNKGEGEVALEFVATHEKIQVLGAIAVASNTAQVGGASVDLTIDAEGRVTQYGVDKEGNIDTPHKNRIYGDTVNILDKLDIPIKIGIGDIGKMKGRDHIRYGSPITKKAVEIILKRSGLYDDFDSENTDR